MSRPRLLALIAFAVSFSPASNMAVGAVGPVPQWLWANRMPGQQQTAYFRKEFTLRAGIRSAELDALADDQMKVFANGKEVANVSEQHLIERIDVTEHLKQGRNALAIEGMNHGGPGGVLLRLNVTYDDARKEQIVTDPTWKATLKAPDGWQQSNFNDAAWPRAIDFGLIGVQPWGDPIGEDEDYDQWKRSLGTAAAIDISSIQVMEGFEVELIRSAAPDEGSWVSLAFDPGGQLTIAREDRGLVRMKLPKSRGEQIAMETINDDLLECRGLLYALDSLFVNANNSKAFYRLRDSDGDDRLDETILLRKTEGGVGHGRNDLVLGPDNSIYLIHGNDTLLPSDFTPGESPYRNFARDRLLPCDWNRHLFNAGTVPPAGHVLRTDTEGSRWDLIAGGFRNPYGIDFNTDGEMFTYDADMEWDVGAPWYRPTRVNHIVPGGDYGWRQGTDKWPAWYPDSLPTTLDIGKGSPTAVKFGTRSSFPPRFQRALFVLDWAYGRIFAVHLIPHGAGYVARADLLVQGRPLNVTDLDFGHDGAMYFTTGGRGTQSGLYRVRYVGQQIAEATPTEDESNESAAAVRGRALRRKLEAFHRVQDPQAIDLAWPHLNSSDPWLRHAARVAIERQPPDLWQQRALAEQDPTAAATALMALARVGDASLQRTILARIGSFDLARWSPEQQLIALRAYQLCLIRMGRPDPDTIRNVAERLEAFFPTEHLETDQLLCELLLFLDSGDVLHKALMLMEHAPTQEQQLFYLFTLRQMKTGWTIDERRRYLAVLLGANAYDGGRTMPQFLQFIRDDFFATLSDAEKQQLKVEIAAILSPETKASAIAVQRDFVREWTADELSDAIQQIGDGRSLERGKQLYTEASCVRCHRLGKEGTFIGPDLTGVARRFSPRDLLESMIDPSKVIDDKYRQTNFELEDGTVLTGTIAQEDEHRVSLAADPLTRHEVLHIPQSQITARKISPLSPMPSGLLNTFSEAEILDLLAYVLASGDARHPFYRQMPNSNGARK